MAETVSAMVGADASYNLDKLLSDVMEAKIIRVHKENISAFLEIVSEAKVVEAPDYIEWGVGDYDRNDLDNWGVDFLVTKPPDYMIGIQLPPGMSGKQAHRIIVRIKE